jgi:hypothetical protein
MRPHLFQNLCCLFFFAFSILKIEAQGPLDGYLKGKGKLDLAPSFSSNVAQKFDGAGGQVFNETYRGSLLSVFAEYGLTPNFDLVGTAAYVFTAEQSGLQDGSFWVKYRPWQRNFSKIGKLNLLLGGGIAAPLADYEPLATGALGTKSVFAPARLILQLDSRAGFFLNFTGGWNFRLDNLAAADIAEIRRVRPDYQPIEPPDFATFLFKIGLPTRRFYADAWLEIQQTRGGADFQQGVPDLPQAYGVSYRQVGGTLYYSENQRNGFFFSAGKFLGGRNLSRVLRLTGGMVFKFGKTA